jgi:hypothetical protein
MDQRSTVVFLHWKGLSTKAADVHTELVQVPGSDAIAYSAVTKYLRNDVVVQNGPEAEDSAEDQSFSFIDNAILEALEILRLPPLCQIAKMTMIPPTTIFHRLRKSLPFVLQRLCWVPIGFGICKNGSGPSSQRSY